VQFSDTPGTVGYIFNPFILYSALLVDSVFSVFALLMKGGTHENKHRWSRNPICDRI